VEEANTELDCWGRGVHRHWWHRWRTELCPAGFAVGDALGSNAWGAEGDRRYLRPGRAFVMEVAFPGSLFCLCQHGHRFNMACFAVGSSHVFCR